MVRASPTATSLTGFRVAGAVSSSSRAISICFPLPLPFVELIFCNDWVRANSRSSEDRSTPMVTQSSWPGTSPLDGPWRRFRKCRYLPLPHPTSIPIDPGGRDAKKFVTSGQGLYRVAEKCEAIELYTLTGRGEVHSLEIGRASGAPADSDRTHSWTFSSSHFSASKSSLAVELDPTCSGPPCRSALPPRVAGVGSDLFGAVGAMVTIQKGHRRKGRVSASNFLFPSPARGKSISCQLWRSHSCQYFTLLDLVP